MRQQSVLDLEPGVVNAFAGMYNIGNKQAPCRGALIDSSFTLVWQSEPFDHNADAKAAVNAEMQRRWTAERNSLPRR